MDNSIPIILLSGLAAVLAIFGYFIVHKFVKPINVSEHQSFLDAMLSIVGTLVSILLGLLVASALDHYRVLEQTVDNEAAAMAQVFRLSTGLPDPIRGEIRLLAYDYCNAVVQKEWPAMQDGHHSPEVVATTAKLIATVVRFNPTTDGQTNIHAALIGAIQQAGDCRRARLLALDNSWNRHLLPVLILCSLIVLVFSFLYAREGAMLHAFLICLVAIALGANLALIYLFSNPFSGDWKIKPKSFIFNLKTIEELRSMPEVQQLLQPNPPGSKLPGAR